jgi:hypothetical protein
MYLVGYRNYSFQISNHLQKDLCPIILNPSGGWWHHRQTAKAPVDLRIFGGFAIYIDGGVDGF